MSKNLMTTTGTPFLEMAKKFFDNDFDYYPSVFETRRNSGLSNVSENEQEYTIEMTAPGLKKEENNDGYYRREFYKSSFQRNFNLPKLVDKENISATMADGILTLTIPKIKEEERKDVLKISIK